jgi:class 3 adenylate cyclase
MAETRKLAAILVADVAGYSRLAGADEDRTLSRLRGLRSDLIDPTIGVHKARVVKGAVDGALVEFRSAVDAVRCAIEVHDAIVERNAGVPADRTRVLAGQDWTRLTVSHPMAKRGGVGPSAKGIREGLREGAKEPREL